MAQRLVMQSRLKYARRAKLFAYAIGVVGVMVISAATAIVVGTPRASLGIPIQPGLIAPSSISSTTTIATTSLPTTMTTMTKVPGVAGSVNTTQSGSTAQLPPTTLDAATTVTTTARVPVTTVTTQPATTKARCKPVVSHTSPHITLIVCRPRL